MTTNSEQISRQQLELAVAYALEALYNMAYKANTKLQMKERARNAIVAIKEKMNHEP